MVMPRYFACETDSSICPRSMYWVLMTLAFFQIEFHVPGFCSFIKFVKVLLERGCVCLRFKSYIIMVASKKCNCGRLEVLLSEMLLM